MKKIILMLGTICLGAHSLAGAPTDPRVLIQPEAAGSLTAGSINYSFRLEDSSNNANVGDTDLVESNTKKLHFIAFDQALKEFTHVHPEFDGKKWNVTMNLPVNGRYSFWAQGQLNDGTEFSSLVKTEVSGGQNEWPILPLGDARKGTDRMTTVEISKQRIRPGQMVMLDLVVTREDGQAPQLTPYLGAFAHVISTPVGVDELEHVHPQAGSQPNTAMLHASFGRPGEYRIWVQLMDHNELKVIPLSVIVSK
jgi:hypothetical protein